MPYEPTYKPTVKLFNLDEQKDEPGLGSDLAHGFTAAANSGLAGMARAVDTVLGDGQDGDIIKQLESNADWNRQQLSSTQQEANQKKFFNDDLTPGKAWLDPRAYTGTVAEAAGSMVPMLAGGGLLSGALKKGVTMAGAKGLANIAGASGYGLAESAMVTGGVSGEIQKAIQDMPDDIVATSPRFQEVFYQGIESGKSEDAAFSEARNTLAKETAIEGMRDVALPSYLLGTVAGRFLDKAIGGKLTGGRLKSAGVGALTEGSTEGAQEAAEQYIQQSKVAEIDPSIDPTQGIADAVARGAIGGGVVGGGLGGIANQAKQNSDNNADKFREGLGYKDTKFADIRKPTWTEPSYAKYDKATEVSQESIDEGNQYLEKEPTQEQVEQNKLDLQASLVTANADNYNQYMLQLADQLGAKGEAILERGAIQDLSNKEIISQLEGALNEQTRTQEDAGTKRGIEAGKNSQGLSKLAQERTEQGGAISQKSEEVSNETNTKKAARKNSAFNVNVEQSNIPDDERTTNTLLGGQREQIGKADKSETTKKTKKFSPTHLTSEKEPVRATEEPNVYVNEQGEEVEDEYATEIRNKTLPNEPQQTPGQVPGLQEKQKTTEKINDRSTSQRTDATTSTVLSPAKKAGGIGKGIAADERQQGNNVQVEGTVRRNEADRTGDVGRVDKQELDRSVNPRALSSVADDKYIEKRRDIMDETRITNIGDPKKVLSRAWEEYEKSKTSDNLAWLISVDERVNKRRLPENFTTRKRGENFLAKHGLAESYEIFADKKGNNKAIRIRESANEMAAGLLSAKWGSLRRRGFVADKVDSYSNAKEINDSLVDDGFTGGKIEQLSEVGLIIKKGEQNGLQEKQKTAEKINEQTSKTTPKKAKAQAAKIPHLKPNEADETNRRGNQKTNGVVAEDSKNKSKVSDTKAKKQAQKLRNVAQRMIDKAQEEQSRDRLSNTSRRANMAAHAINRAMADEALAKSMMNIADAVETGKVVRLARVSNKAQVELLNSILRSAMYDRDASRFKSYAEQEQHKGRMPERDDIEFTKYPSAEIHQSNVPRLLEALRTKRGGMKLRTSIRNVITQEQYDKIKKLFGDKEAESLVGWYPVEALKKIKRLKSMGIDNQQDLRGALSEFISLKEGVKQESEVTKLERELVGKKGIGIDFFPTPKSLAERMVNEAGIKSGMKVLEPSAGNGNISDAMKAKGADVDVIELSSELRKILKAKEHNIVEHDFMNYAPDFQYDAIIMNPPFSNSLDAQHVQHAYTMLKPGGKLFAITGEGVHFRSDKKATEFRNWLEDINAEVEKLPAKTFLDKNLPATTGVNARLVKIEKPRDTQQQIGEDENPINNLLNNESFKNAGKNETIKNNEQLPQQLKSYDNKIVFQDKGKQNVKFSINVEEDVLSDSEWESYFGGERRTFGGLSEATTKRADTKQRTTDDRSWTREERDFNRATGLNPSEAFRINEKIVPLIHRSRTKFTHFDDNKRGSNTYRPFAKLGHFTSTTDDLDANTFGEHKNEYYFAANPDEVLEISTDEMEMYGGFSDAQIENLRNNLIKSGIKVVAAPGVKTYIVLEGKNAFPKSIDGVAKFSKGKSTGTTVDQVKTIITNKYRKAKKMLSDGSLVVVQSVEDLPNELLAKSEELRKAIKSGIPLNVEGLYFDGKTYLVADMLNAGNIEPVFLHEMLHKSLAENPNLKQRLENNIGGLRDIFEQTKSGKYKGRYKTIYDAALKRVEKANTPEADEFEEFLAYAVSLAQTKQQSIPARLKQAISNLVSTIRAALYKAGVTVKLRPNDLAALARQAIGRKSFDMLGFNSKYSGIVEDMEKRTLPDKIIIDGKEKWTINSKGQQLARTEDGVKSFWKWFGNSSVVDDEGNPLVVYHGTSKIFTEFSKEYLGEKTEANSANLGFYFTDSPRTASDYTRIIPKKIIPKKYRDNSDNMFRQVKENTPDSIIEPVNKYFDAREEVLNKVSDDFKNVLEKKNNGDIGINYNELFNALNKYDKDASKELESIHNGDKYFSNISEFNSKILKGLYGIDLFHYGEYENINAIKNAIIDSYGSIAGTVAAGYSPNIIPVYLKLINKNKFDAKNKTFEYSFTRINQNARRAYKNGKDGYTIKNIVDGGNESNHFIVFEPNQIRSIYANFNPELVNSGNLLASTKYSIASTAWEGLKESETTEYIKNRLGRATSTAKAQSFGLLTLRQIADVTKKVLPEIKRTFIKTIHDMDTEKNKRLSAAGEIATDWSSLPKKISMEMSDLMHDSTIAGVDGSKPYVPVIDYDEANKRIKSIRQQMRDRSGEDKSRMLREIEELKMKMAFEKKRKLAYPLLQERYEKLNSIKVGKPWISVIEDGRKVYHTFDNRRQFNDFSRQNTIENSGLNDATRIYNQARDYHEQHFADTMEALTDRITQSKASPVVKKSLMAQLRQKFESLQAEAPYFPLARFGEYWVHTSTGDETMFNMFESEKEQKSFIEQMEKEGVVVLGSGKQLENLSEIDGVSAEFITEVDSLISQLGDVPMVNDLRDSVYQLYLNTLPDVSARKHFIHRKKTKGFHNDQLRAFAYKALHDANNISKLMYGYKLQAVLDQSKDVLDIASSSVKAESVQQDIEQMQEFLRLDPSLTEIKRRLKETEDEHEHEMYLRFRKWRENYNKEEIKTLIKHNERLMELSKNIKPDDKIFAANALNELRKSYKDLMNPKLNPIAQMLNSLGFAYYLGLTPAAAIVNVTQTPVVALPLLASKVGWGTASKMMGQATTVFLKGMKAGKKNGMPWIEGLSIEEQLKGDELRAYQEWIDSGLIDVTLAHDLAGLSDEGVLTNTFKHKLMNVLSFGFHHAERMNREITALAAYRAARVPKSQGGQGMTHSQAVQFAEDIVWDSHFNYASSNRARFMRGNVARVVTQFKQYSQNLTYLYGRTFQQAFSENATPQEKTEARRALRGLLTMQFAAAGTLGLPVVGVMMETAQVLKDIFGDDDEPEDIKGLYRQALADVVTNITGSEDVGNRFGLIMSKGFVDGFTPYSVSGRLSASDLWVREANRELEGTDQAWQWAKTILGPMAGLLLENPAIALNMAQDGHYERAVEYMMPKAVKDTMKALRYSMDGVENLRGDKLVDDYSIVEGVGQLLGFASSQINEIYDQNNAIKRLEHKLNDRRQRLLTKAARAKMEGNMSAYLDAQKEIRGFNTKNPGQRITSANIRQSIKGMKRRTAETSRGLYMTKRNRGLADRYRFAN